MLFHSSACPVESRLATAVDAAGLTEGAFAGVHGLNRESDIVALAL